MPHLMSSQRENKKEQKRQPKEIAHIIDSHLRRRSGVSDTPAGPLNRQVVWLIWWPSVVHMIDDTTNKFLIRNLSYKCKSAGQQIQHNDDDQRIFKMIGFRNGNRCKYVGSHHKSSFLGVTQHMPMFRPGWRLVSCQRGCVTLSHCDILAGDHLHIFGCYCKVAVSVLSPFCSSPAPNSSFFASLAWVGQILRRSD